MQMNIEESDQRGDQRNVQATKCNNNESPFNKELCDSVTEFAAISTPCKENHNHNKETIPRSKPRRRKHRPKVIRESKPKRTRKPVTPNPVQSTCMRKYARRKRSTPQTEVTIEWTKPLISECAKKTCRRSLNFDQQRDENPACRESAIKEQALNNYRSESDTQTPSTNLSKSSPKILSKSVAQSSPNDSNRRRSPRLQIVGSKRKHNGTIEHADTKDSKKNRGSEKGENPNTSFGTATKEDVRFRSQQTKRRSRAPTRMHPCALESQKQGCPDRQTFGDAERSQTSLTKKKRTKRRSNHVSSANYCTNEMQQHHKFVLEDISLDVACEEIWKNIHALTERFTHLNINREGRELVLHGQNALVPYNQQNQKHEGLIQGYGTIIPFEDPVRKQRPRPKVDLDEETNRVWKLLMLDSNSHGIDGTDEERAKWWEEERNVFRGRADSFIARMHLIQGDRRFSQWKGSVVDSVVGVFLTQNVSDHLSSSAFMSLAARFPLKSSSNYKTYHEESTSLIVNKPQVYIVEPENSPMESGQISAMTEEGQENSCHAGVSKELNDAVSSQCYVITSQISGDFSIDQNPEKIGSSSDSNSEVEDLPCAAKCNNFYEKKSFSKLLEMASSTMLHEVDSQSIDMKHDTLPENLEKSNVTQGSLEASSFKTEASSSGSSKNKDENDMRRLGFLTESESQAAIAHSQNSKMNSAPTKLNIKGHGKDEKDDLEWDSLRIKAQAKAGKREKTEKTMDSLDWNAVRRADIKEIADAIRERGMNNKLAERIKNFLNRLVVAHEAIDLEWLRDVPPDQAKEYLLSIEGLGLKSVECVRLLTLNQLAFPVDTNVARIAVRLGWVPLQPLPESLQLHLLELYPMMASIQKYLWPRLCKLDQRTLYELHYQLITFGKVFCTKSKPNCNACPMRGECRHFASAFASARLALPGPEQKSIVTTSGNNPTYQKPSVIINQLPWSLPENTSQAEELTQTEASDAKSEINICQPIIEEPATPEPEPECSQVSENDIEDAFYEESCEIPIIKLLQSYMQENTEHQEGEVSKALVALTQEAACIPMPELKNVSRLRTKHCVYELPDSHPLLKGWEKRDPDDPGKYLLAIWTPGETANSIQPAERKCSSQDCGQLCNEKECFSCNSFREANSQIVRGTILIPCRTATRGSFPLNGTYFQVNEVFADDGSSVNPINVPRSWIWNLNRRTVYFGTSVSAIFKGLSTQEIQQCFLRGFVCVRGFERETRYPRPLKGRLHFPASKLTKNKESKTREGATSGNLQEF